MNLANLKKADIVKMANYRCKHRHTGLEHPECYFEETGAGERLAFFDIEASNLKATFGLMWSYCLKPDGEEPIANIVTPKEIKNGTYDKRLYKDLTEDLMKFDRVVGHYMCRFDLPFVRTRCVYHGIPFPPFGSLKQKDTWVILRKKFGLHSNRLQTACEFFGIESKGHPMKQDIWLSAFRGDQKALDYILAHNKEDVASTEALWHKIEDYMRLSDTSI